MKRCTKCGVEKPESGYAPSAWVRRSPQCRDCFAAYNRIYYQANQEQRRVKRKAYRAANRERLNAAARKWRTENPERVKVNWKAWYNANASKHKAASQKWYRTHPEEVKARNSRPEERARNRAWKKANPDKVLAGTRRRRAQKLAATVDGAPVTPAGIAARSAMWGDRCWVCGGPQEHVDHVKPLAAGGLHVLANLRPICAPCNYQKSSTWPLEALYG